MLLLNRNKVMAMMKAFYELTDMAIGLLDMNGICIIGYPSDTECDYCKMMRAHDHQFFLKCVECDAMNFNIAKETMRRHNYTCHAGLIESVAPIQRDGATIGFIRIGQTLYKETALFERMKIFNNTLSNYPCDPQVLARAIENIPTISINKIHAYQTLLDAIALYLHSDKIITRSQTEFISKLDEYIMMHINESIKIDDLCKHFLISRSNLYKCVHDYVQIPLVAYIIVKRMNRAKELLLETEMSIQAIAETVGYSDLSYFSSLFKKNFGVSPRSFRKDPVKDAL